MKLSSNAGRVVNVDGLLALFCIFKHLISLLVVVNSITLLIALNFLPLPPVKIHLLRFLFLEVAIDQIVNYVLYVRTAFLHSFARHVIDLCKHHPW